MFCKQRVKYIKQLLEVNQENGYRAKIYRSYGTQTIQSALSKY